MKKTLCSILFLTASLTLPPSALAADGVDPAAAGPGVNWVRAGLTPFTINFKQNSATGTRALSTNARGFGFAVAYERLIPQWKILAGLNFGAIRLGNAGGSGTGIDAGLYVKRSIYQASAQFAILANIELRRENMLLNRPANTFLSVGDYGLHGLLTAPIGIEGSFPIGPTRAAIGANYHLKIASPGAFALSSFTRFDVSARLGYSLTPVDSLRLIGRLDRITAGYDSPAAAPYVAEAGTTEQTSLLATLEYIRRF